MEEAGETGQDVRRRFSAEAEAEETLEVSEKASATTFYSVTNIQTAADAREVSRRAEVEEARRIRVECLERDARSSQEQCEELIRGWFVAKEKVMPQELQEALDSQQQLCSTIIESKKTLISELKQELKAADDGYVRNLRKHREELDLMLERIEQHKNSLINSYREEMTEIERTYQQESEAFLKADKPEREKHLSQRWKKELERLRQRKKKVEENVNALHNQLLEAIDQSVERFGKQCGKLQAVEREQWELKGANVLLSLKEIKPHYESMEHKTNRMRDNNLMSKRAKHVTQKEESAKKTRCLSEGLDHNVQQYKHLQQITKSSASADARKYREMWLMLEEEVKQLVDRALVIDALICKRLGLPWAKRSVTLTERPQQGRGSTGTRAGSAGTDESSEVSGERMKKVLELLCDEAGFLVGDRLLKLLAPLQKKDQTLMKLDLVLSALGIKQRDLPKLALFLLKYEEQTEDDQPGASSVQTEPGESYLIHPNHIIPALKCFLEAHASSRATSSHQQSGPLDFEAWDRSECKTYWENMGNVIPKERVQLWEAAQHILSQHLSVLKDNSQLIAEAESLKRQNAELRMLLNSEVNTGFPRQQ